MEELDSDQLINKLEPLFENGRLGLLSGAGVSICSGIPDALTITKEILSILNCDGEDIANYLSLKSESEIAQLPVAFESIIGTLAESVEFADTEKDFFEVFANNFIAPPNHNHYLWADLLNTGRLTFIATTNFDTCFEQALDIEPMGEYVLCPYQIANDKIKDRPLKNTIIKLHGGIKNPKEMGTTINQITKKESILNIDNFIKKIFCRNTHNTLLIVGYSCSDRMDIVPKIQSLGHQLKDKDKVNIIYWAYNRGGSNFTWEDLSKAKTTPVNKNAKKTFKEYKNSIQISGDLDIFVERYTNKSRLIFRKNFAFEKKIKNPKKVLGALFQEAGRYEKAIKYIKEFLTTQLSDPKTSHRQLAKTYRDLGKAHNFDANYNESLKFYKRALKVQKNDSNVSDSEIADTYIYLGECLRDIGEFTKSINYYHRALNIYYDKFGNMNPTVAEIHNNLSDVYSHKEEFENAIDHSEISLDIRLELYGEVHNRISNTYNNLGFAYSGKEDYEKAAIYYQKSLDIREAIYGEKHDWVAQSNNNLGYINYKKGDFDEAIKFYNNALDICLDTLSDKHFMIATLYNNIGNTHRKLEEYQEALDYLNKALSLWKKIFGSNHYYVANTYNSIGKTYQQSHEPDKALEYYQKSIDVAEISIDKGNSLYKIIQNNIKELKSP